MIDNILNTKVKRRPLKRESKFYDEYYSDEGRIELMNSPYKGYNEHLCTFILDYLQVPFDKRLKLLDTGCGGGKFLFFANKRVKVYGNEISSVCLEYAGKLCKEATLKQCSVEKLAFNNNYFDFIAAMGVFEHFPDLDIAFKELKRVLKPNGKMIIYVPNIFFIFGVLKVGLLGGWPSHGTEVERFNTLDGWQQIIENSGFKVVKKTSYNPVFSIERADINKPHVIIAKLLWLVIKHFIPVGLSYNLVYVVVNKNKHPDLQ